MNRVQRDWWFLVALASVAACRSPSDPADPSREVPGAAGVSPAPIGPIARQNEPADAYGGTGGRVELLGGNSGAPPGEGLGGTRIGLGEAPGRAPRAF